MVLLCSHAKQDAGVLFFGQLSTSHHPPDKAELRDGRAVGWVDLTTEQRRVRRRGGEEEASETTGGREGVIFKLTRGGVRSRAMKQGCMW